MKLTNNISSEYENINQQHSQKLPPHSIEAEESIITTLLLDDKSMVEVMEILSYDDFYKPAHKKIFLVITELFRKGEPVDIITVTNTLRSKDLLKNVGGATYVAQLTNTVPIVVNVPHYAKIIKDKAILRSLIRKTNEIMLSCYKNDNDLSEIINNAENVIFEISENNKTRSTNSINPISQIIQSSINSIEDRQGNNSLITGIPTGFIQIDKLTSGLQNSELIIIAARPAMGKTAFALNIARNAAFEAKKSVLFFSLEMSKEQLVERLLCSEARVDASRVKHGFLNNGDWNKLTNAAGRLTETPIYIDDSPDISITSIKTKSKRFKINNNVDLIIVDYLQLMTGSKKFDRRDLEIAEISRSLKMLAKELKIPIIAISQLNRKLEDRIDKRPQLADLRESGALEQDADIVKFIYRDEIYNKDQNNPNRGIAEIILSKHRNGPTGFTKLAFLDSYTRFENLSI